MERKYEEIKDLALSFQDKRDDVGHADITLHFAQKLLLLEPGNPGVVIPATTLHDTGWSQLPEEERFLALQPDTDPDREKEIRLKHQKEGVKITRRILKEVGYDEALTGQILEIISQHDTRVGSFSKEDAIVRDADKLWRFSEIGFQADLRRTGISSLELYNKLEKNIDKENFFFTESARVLARKAMKELRSIAEGGV